MSDLTIEQTEDRLDRAEAGKVCGEEFAWELSEALTTALHALEENELLRKVEAAAWNHIHGNCGDTSELCNALAELERWREGR